MMPDRRPLGEQLRAFREAQGKTLQDIAGEGVSESSLGRIERGERNPSVKTLERVVSVLNCRIVIEPEATHVEEAL